MSFNNNSSTNSNNGSNRKSKENLRELSYLVEEERLLADLKRKSEETLQKLKVEELTLLRFVQSLAGLNSDPNKPIMFPDNSYVNNCSSNINNISNINSNTTMSTMEQNVDNTEELKLSVGNLLMTIENDQDVEIEEEDEEN